jgi:Flp pilus assembly pilin Flp
MKRKAWRGQSTIEYTLLIVIVAAALTAMYWYLLGSAKARAKQSDDELVNSQKNYEDITAYLN